MAKLKLDIKTKRVYDKVEKKDGHRILTMRLWPRGIRLDQVNVWLKDLGPKRDLLFEFKKGKVKWPKYSKLYLEGLESEEARRALIQLIQTVDSRRFTLLCACKDLKRCHTSLLRAYLLKWARQS